MEYLPRQRPLANGKRRQGKGFVRLVVRLALLAMVKMWVRSVEWLGSVCANIAGRRGGIFWLRDVTGGLIKGE